MAASFRGKRRGESTVENTGIVSAAKKRQGRSFAAGVESLLVSISSDIREDSGDIVTQFSPPRL